MAASHQAPALVLSRDELASLTGYRRPSLQARWLKQQGFKFRLGRDLHPRVDRGHYNSRMGAGPASSSTGPDWSSIGV
jgi:hypothetical protein